MGRIARRVLSAVAPLLWLAAIGLVVFRQSDGSHAADGYLMGYAMMLGLLALAGTLCGALRDIGRGPAELLLQALKEASPQPEDDRRLRAVGGVPQSATRSSTRADEASVRRPRA